MERGGAPAAAPEGLSPESALALPFLFTIGLAAFGLLPAARQNAVLQFSFFGAAAALLGWGALLFTTASSGGRRFRIEVSVRKQHWLQACAHLSIYAYWGWHWRPVYHAAYLIAAQLLFAYAFDMLLAWSRRGSYTLGFGPLPVIFSTNLFLWFKPDWFYLQFLMVGLGFLVKELVRWQKDGRPAHIFNPSSFALAVFSIILIVTGKTDHTYGQEIATTLFYPPHIYLYIFLIGLPGQFFFGVTAMTLSAVVTVFAFTAAYFAVTGTYFFFDCYIPIAVFLGMHLLFTDPSTAPRSELGRIFFGVLYGTSVMLLYWLLGLAGADTFYDKLLPVPILNLFIQAIDRLARSARLRAIDPSRLGRALSPRRRNLAYMAVWACVFGAISAANGFGDSHPGNRIPFWEDACREGKRNGCRNLATMEAKFCYRGVGWACNELGVHVAEGRIAVEPTPRQLFQRACDAGLPAGCENASLVGDGADLNTLRNPNGTLRLQHQEPAFADYDQLIESKGVDKPETQIAMLQLACNQGWKDACTTMAFRYLKGETVKRDPARAAREYDKACTGGGARACSDLGLMYKLGEGVEKDQARALDYLKKACALDMPAACRWLREEQQPKMPGPGQQAMPVAPALQEQRTTQ